MNARQQRVGASARWITTRAEVLLLMRRALAAAAPAGRTARDPPDDTDDAGQPTPIRNALPMPMVRIEGR
jgi:hypothetical protein